MDPQLMTSPPPDIEAAYRRFGEAVHHRARRIVRDEALADDVMQETFLRAHRYRHTWQGGSMLSWLFTIADRVSCDHLRRRGVVVDSDAAAAALAAVDADAVTGTASVAATRPMNAQERLLRDEQVGHALALADDDTIQILLHRYIDELATDDIARQTGHSERTIRRRLASFFSQLTTPTTPREHGGPDARRL